MRLIRRLLFSPGRLKRKVLAGMANLVFGPDREFTSFIMKTHANPACEDISRGLEQRLERAVPECVREIEGFIAAAGGGNSLSERFEHNFNQANR